MASAVLEAPLRLDADDQVDPSGAALTPDGGTLLVTVVGSSDLYMLELGEEGAYWNLASLGAEPATLAVWDNRLCLHQAYNDHDGHRREMYRTTVLGERPQ